MQIASEQGSIYAMMWRVYDRLGDTSLAYNYHLKYSALKDSIAIDRLQQNLTMLNFKMKDEEQQAHINLLKKNNEIERQQLQQQSLLKNILIISLFTVAVIGFIIFRNISLKRKNEKLLLERELKEQQVASERVQYELKQQAAELEMQALRAQMNPHFIFNCLSSINSFILKNKTDEASDYLTKFSRLIRMVLNNSKQEYISLEDELETLRLYIEMERLRFKNSFDYSITCNNELEISNIFIPPVLLQPFVENAIWHGLMHKQNGGHLDIDLREKEKKLICIISDNGIGRKQAALMKSKSVEKQKSMGLKITAARLAMVNKRDDGETAFIIKDLADENGNACGTKVILHIHYKNLAEL